MIAQHYAQALHELAKNADALASEQVIKNFKSLLEKRGHQKLYPQIVSAFEQLLAREEQVETKVRVARDTDIKTFQEEILIRARDMQLAGQTLNPIVDETLVGGYRIESKDSLYDASYKRSLIDLYKTLTT